MDKFPTISLRFDRRKTAANGGKGTVEVLVSYKGAKLYVPTGVRVAAASWRDGRVVSHRDAVMLNKQVTDVVGRVHREASRLWDEGAFSLDGLRSALRQAPAGVPPVEWIAAQVESRQVRASTKMNHRALVHNLIEYGLFRAWTDFTPAAVMAYDAWLHGRGLSQGTVRNYHKRLKVYLTIARRDGLLSGDPYDGIKIERPKPVRRKYLTDEQRAAFEARPLTGALAKVRDLFMWQCWTGMGYADMAEFDAGRDLVTEGGETFIVGTRQKTGTGYRIMLLDKAREILERYGGRLPVMTNQKYNYFLKVAAAGIRDDITSHMARHTFATWALRNGVPIEVISAMLAHTNISVTQIYAEQLQEHVNEEYRRLNLMATTNE